MCDVDLEPATVWNETTVTARKQHRCACCDAVIQKGERYRRVSVLYEGRWTAERACLVCEDVSDRFRADHGMTTTPSGVPDLLWGCIDGADRDEVQDWRRDLAGILRRSRAAKRAKVAHG